MAIGIWLFVWWVNGNPDFINPTLDTVWVAWLLSCLAIDLVILR